MVNKSLFKYFPFPLFVFLCEFRYFFLIILVVLYDKGCEQSDLVGLTEDILKRLYRTQRNVVVTQLSDLDRHPEVVLL